MSLKDDLSYGFQTLVSKTGKPIRLRYYTGTHDAVYDDAPYLNQSGNDLWTSGIVLPLSQKSSTSSADYLLVEQGKLNSQDQRLYINGSLLTVGSSVEVKIGLGSPNTDQFSIIPLGGIPVETEGVKIYKKVFIRRLTNGSLAGEV